MYQNARELRCGKRGHSHMVALECELLHTQWKQLGNIYENQNFTGPLT